MQFSVYWFCILQTYWIYLLVRIVILVNSLGFSVYGIMSSSNNDSFTSSFPIWMPFISYFYLIVWLRLSILHWINGGSGHPCLLPDFRGKVFSFSPLSMMLAVGLSYTAFIMLRYVPSILTSLRVFNINGFEFWQILFLHLLR